MNLTFGAILWEDLKYRHDLNKSRTEWKSQLRFWVDFIIESCGGYFDHPFLTFQRNVDSYDDLTDFPIRLVDAALHDGDEALLHGKYEDILAITTYLTEFLMERQKEIAEFDLGSHILLWCATSYGKNEQLDRAVKLVTSRCTVPYWHSASFLIRAIELGVPKQVATHLQYGADPNRPKTIPKRGLGAKFQDPPLVVALNVSDYYHGITPRIFGKINADIVALLLKYGANALVEIDRGILPLHLIAQIALHAPEAANLLTRESPIEAYAKLIESPNCSLVSPFGAALWDSFGVECNQRIDRQVILFTFALAPLLRLGADIMPHFMESQLGAHVSFLTSEAKSLHLWGQCNMFVNFLIESTRSGALKVTSDDSQLAKIVRSQFPRSLQALARIAILKQMPVGVTRFHAISSLQLPQCIESYLTFREFDIDAKTFAEYWVPGKDYS